MSDLLPDPPRWKERTDQANLAEREAGRAIRSMRMPEPLPAVQLARIAARVRTAWPRRYFWLTVTAGLLLCGATVASAAHLHVLPGWLTRIVKPYPAELAPHKRASLGGSLGRSFNLPSVPAQAIPESKSAHPNLADLIPGGNAGGRDTAPSAPRKRSVAETAPVERPRIPQLPPDELEPPGSLSLGPVPAAAVPSDPVQPRGTHVARLEGANPVAEASGAQGTAKYLSEAIHALRVDHAPGTALFLLDQHATQLGKSAFAHEALLLRVEAMLALGRKAEVLRLLDGAVLTDVAASRSLLVTRGELRAAANRCADSLGDFDLVLAKSKQPDRQALFGRALCRKKLGDGAGARADVERYRREFPTDPGLSDLARK